MTVVLAGVTVSSTLPRYCKEADTQSALQTCRIGAAVTIPFSGGEREAQMPMGSLTVPIRLSPLRRWGLPDPPLHPALRLAHLW